MSDEVNLRFRHTQGDVGPSKFAVTTSILNVKERVLSLWPKEGPLAAEHPTSAADIKLILAGKITDNAKTLQDYKREMGEYTPESIVTMHLVVRPPTAPKAGATGAPDTKEPKGCSCCIQ
jgi:hypothetical protein